MDDAPSTVAGIDRLIVAARTAGHAHLVVDLGPVGGRLIEQAAAAGLDITGMSHAADTSAIRHVLRQHGDERREARRGQLAARLVDLRAIPAVLLHPDRIVLGLTNNRSQDQVASVEALMGGVTIYVEEVRLKRNTLALASMRRFPRTIDATRLAATLDPHVRNAPQGPLKISTCPTGSRRRGADPSAVANRPRRAYLGARHRERP